MYYGFYDISTKNTNNVFCSFILQSSYELGCVLTLSVVFFPFVQHYTLCRYSKYSRQNKFYRQSLGSNKKEKKIRIKPILQPSGPLPL